MRYDLSTDGMPCAMGQVLPLPPKEREVLAMLISDAPAAVSKERLLAKVWGGRPVSDESLARCISQLRRLLPAIQIESIYGYGYRLLPAEEELDAQFQRAAQAPSPVLAAYLYANNLVQARTLSALREARQILAELLERYPRFAPGHVLQAAGIAAAISWGIADELGLRLADAFAHLDAADRIDATSPGSLACRAWLLDLTWRFHEAARCYERALALAPRDVPTLCSYGRHLLSLGQAERAVEVLRPVPVLQPYSSVNRHLCGLALFYAGHVEQAITECARAAALYPQNLIAEGLRLNILLRLCPSEDLLQQVRRLTAQEPTTPYFTSLLAHALARCGRREEALAMIAAIDVADPVRLPGAVFYLPTLCDLDELERASQLVETLFATGSGSLPILLQDPLVSALHRDARAAGVLRRLREG